MLNKKKIKNLLFNFIIFMYSSMIFILSLIIKGFFKNRKIWLICETDVTAQDNGYHFFKWMRENHPEIETHYLINKRSKDYEKVASLGNVVSRLSFYHILYLFMAEKHIGTHDYRHWAYPGKRSIFQKYFEKHLKGEFIQLQHGILHMRGERGFHYNPMEAKYDKVIVSSEWEKRLLNEHFGHPDQNLIVTGLARYDNLYKSDVVEDQIFFMPTWRKAIRKRELFICSDYYLKTKEILEDKNLLKKLREKKIKVKFYLHIKLHKFIDLFQELENDVIEIVEAGDEDVQTLLKKSKLLITDYSSISFDFIYMEKPVLFYQYDYKDYIESYRVQGYEEYKNDRFGYIAYNSKTLIDKIIYYLDNDFKAEEEYIKKSNKYFKFRDNNNCQRIYNEIIEPSKKDCK